MLTCHKNEKRKNDTYNAYYDRHTNNQLHHLRCCTCWHCHYSITFIYNLIIELLQRFSKSASSRANHLYENSKPAKVYFYFPAPSIKMSSRCRPRGVRRGRRPFGGPCSGHIVLNSLPCRPKQASRQRDTVKRQWTTLSIECGSRRTHSK